MGQQVKTATTTELIDISTLENGLYFLNIMFNNTTQINKMIKTT
ncbi:MULTISPECIES: T9SS type A sorting domain-containing protein [Bizionia]|uniref:T9SS type A sorting domain-containing protein n=1 Tax=Bizionia algoritergicola TaxID=291187 RepID=A0A5D0QXA0_9FLAO|nr:T9SS type A sorting domain-containing protein [Bizionia algoritergicola]UPS91304.1 T9SS type A sorting domain-containing protein [Bizionia sp. M204]